MIIADSLSSATVSRPAFPTDGGGGIGDPTPDPGNTGRTFVPIGGIGGEGGPTPPSSGTGQGGDTINVTYNGGTNSVGNGTAPVVPDAKSDFADALAALAGLFGQGPSSSAAPSPQTVAVPVQNVGSDSSGSTTGRGVIIVAGIVLGLGALGYYAIKKGWFKKAEKAATGDGGKEK